MFDKGGGKPRPDNIIAPVVGVVTVPLFYFY
jgi:hypothetical protein